MRKLGLLARWPAYQLTAGKSGGNSKCIEAAHVCTAGGAGRPGYVVASACLGKDNSPPSPGSEQEHIRLDCTVNELVCIAYRGIIDLRFTTIFIMANFQLNYVLISVTSASNMQLQKIQIHSTKMYAYGPGKSVGGHTIIFAYVRFNQHAYDEHFIARARKTPEVVCVRTMTVVVKITTSLSTHVVVRPPSGG